MDTVFKSQLNLEEKLSTEIKMKTMSATIVPFKGSDQLQPQISAPCHFYSLSTNDAPPFKIPQRKPKPHLLIGTVVGEGDVIEMIAAKDCDSVKGLRKFLEYCLVKKKMVKNHHLSEKKFLVSLLMEVIDYAAQRDYSASKLACLLTIYLCTHQYFQWYYWLPASEVWGYFKEIMIRHTIQDSPDGQEVFQPEECYDILTHFHSIYISNLPLVNILTFGVHRFKLQWPFKPKA